MKITKTLLVAAVAAAALAATAADAARGGGNGGGGRGSGGWSGNHGGHGHGRGASNGGRHWGGGGYRHYGGHGYRHGGYWRGGYSGWYVGAPLLWGAYAWGWPYWDSYYYPSSTVVYREAYPMSVAPSTNEFEVSPVPRGEGAPTQAPAYRNYCESAQAYYPKVTTCPEGWRFEPAPSR